MKAESIEEEVLEEKTTKKRKECHSEGEGCLECSEVRIKTEPVGLNIKRRVVEDSSVDRKEERSEKQNDRGTHKSACFG